MARNLHVRAGNVTFGNDLPMVLIAGPCALESRAHAMAMCGELVGMARELSIPFVYKTSFDKANRTSASSPRGVGIEEGVAILAELGKHFGCAIMTDIHAPEQCAMVARGVDILQIPAFLCRQTDLLQAAGRTGCAINIKKGQFMAPWDVAHAALKVAGAGNEQILLCERGVSFGYNNLVCDMRALAIMAETGYPVVFDATHAVQQPGGMGTTSGGQREFVPVLARAAVAVGVAAVFIETHENPDQAPSDGPNMVPLCALPPLVASLMAIDRLGKPETCVRVRSDMDAMSGRDSE